MHERLAVATSPQSDTGPARPPEAPEMKGGSCGFKSDGTWSCTGETGKGPLELDPESLPSMAPRHCRGDRRRRVRSSAGTGSRTSAARRASSFDQAQRSCASPSKEQPIKPFELPSSPPLPQKGDFPLPDESQAYA
jgi:hypothetical protein